MAFLCQCLPQDGNDKSNSVSFQQRKAASDPAASSLWNPWTRVCGICNRTWSSRIRTSTSTPWLRRPSWTRFWWSSDAAAWFWSPSTEYGGSGCLRVSKKRKILSWLYIKNISKKFSYHLDAHLDCNISPWLTNSTSSSRWILSLGWTWGLRYIFQVEALEVITGFEGANKYKVGEKKFPSNKLLIAQVLNSAGQEVYKVMEDTDCCTRQVILSYWFCCLYIMLSLLLIPDKKLEWATVGQQLRSEWPNNSYQFLGGILTTACLVSNFLFWFK